MIVKKKTYLDFDEIVSFEYKEVSQLNRLLKIQNASYTL